MINCNISIVFNDDTTKEQRDLFMDRLDEFVEFNGFQIKQKPKEQIKNGLLQKTETPKKPIDITSKF
jgi:hypothetical protein